MLSMPVLTCPKPHFSWLLPKKKKKNPAILPLLIFSFSINVVSCPWQKLEAIFSSHLHRQLCVKTVQPKQASAHSVPSCWLSFRLDPHGLSAVTLHRASSLLLPLGPHDFTLTSPPYFCTSIYFRNLDLGLKTTNSINNISDSQLPKPKKDIHQKSYIQPWPVWPSG